MRNERRGIYPAHWADRLTFRRTFVLHTNATPEGIQQRLAALSQPPPANPTPFKTSVSVAVAHTLAHTGMFEVHIVRGTPWGDHFSSVVAAGRAHKQDNGEGYIIAGEIQPSPRGTALYTGLITLLSLWLSVVSVLSVFSPIRVHTPVIIASSITVAATAMTFALLSDDLQQLTTILTQIQ